MNTKTYKASLTRIKNLKSKLEKQIEFTKVLSKALIRAQRTIQEKNQEIQYLKHDKEILSNYVTRGFEESQQWKY